MYVVERSNTGNNGQQRKLNELTSANVCCTASGIVNSDPRIQQAINMVPYVDIPVYPAYSRPPRQVERSAILPKASQQDERRGLDSCAFPDFDGDALFREGVEEEEADDRWDDGGDDRRHDDGVGM